MSKNLLKTVLVNVLVVCLFFLVLEGVARIWGDQIRLSGTDRSMIQNYMYEDTPGLRPGSEGISNEILYKVDNWSFWEYDRPKQKNDISWLLLGDSVTMGIGVQPDSTFSGLLHNQLDSINVLNSALIGYASADYKNIAQTLLPAEKHNIKRVLLFWTLNDVYQNNIPDQNYPGQQLKVINNVKTFLRQNLKFYHLLKAIFFDRSKSYYQYDSSFYDEKSELLNQAISDIAGVMQVAEKQGLDLSLFLLPYEYQLRNRDGDKEMFSPQKIMKSKLKKAEIEVERIVDCSTFFGTMNSERYYMYGDGIHFSKKGHRVIKSCVRASIPR